DAAHLARREIEQYRATRRQRGQSRDLGSRDDLAAVLYEQRDQRVRDALRPALRNRPADDMAQHGEEEAVPGSRGGVERQSGMRRRAGDQSARLVAGKP